MKVYDCFTFYNEFELLELRLKSLYDVVDYFVIVEADKTLNNKPKPFYFDENKDKFAEFLPKIRNIKINMDIPYKGTGDWSIEFAQRNAISHGLKDAAPDDLIFISDLDEIWSPDILQRINNRQVPLLANYAPPCRITELLYLVSFWYTLLIYWNFAQYQWIKNCFTTTSIGRRKKALGKAQF